MSPLRLKNSVGRLCGNAENFCFSECSYGQHLHVCLSHVQSAVLCMRNSICFGSFGLCPVYQYEKEVSLYLAHGRAGEQEGSSQVTLSFLAMLHTQS